MTKQVQNPLKGYTLTIDGPASAGKGTLGKALSYRYRLKYLDTGTLYRTVAYKVKEAGGSFKTDKDALKILKDFNFDFKHAGNNQFIVLLDNKDITSKIRTMEVGIDAAKVAVFSKVREELNKFQVEYANINKELYGVLMDGRDIGVTICPNADFKFFLEASAETRAKRRHIELIEHGNQDTYENILKGIKQRDELDRNRAHSPLKPAKDAFIIDTTKIDAYTVLRKVIKSIEEKTGVTKSISAE